MSFIATLITGVLINTGNNGEKLTKLTWSQKNATATSTYKGGKYCGPGWGFTYQDILDGNIRELPQSIDAIDEACKMHDYCYHENGYFTQGCNLVLTYDLVKVVVDYKSAPQQRLDAVLMAAIFFIESQTIDLGIIAKEEALKIKSQILSNIYEAGNTLQTAIKNQMRARGAGIP